VWRVPNIALSPMRERLRLLKLYVKSFIHISLYNFPELLFCQKEFSYENVQKFCKQEVALLNLKSQDTLVDVGAKYVLTFTKSKQ